MNKTIVVGIDGAHFELITPWLKDGTLPNIQKCIENGITADMEVCLPPVTSPNWKCYSTGKNPAKLGIFWWENIDKKEKKVYYPSWRKNEHMEIWDYLSQAGYKVCVIGTPLTYPPKKINGFMISGGLDAANHDFTYPKALEKKLKHDYNYRIRPKHSIERNREKAIKEIHELIASRFEVALDLMEKHDLDFVQITSFYINVLQHFFWNSQVTKTGWQIIDEYVGKLLNKQNHNLVFMSDHGSNRIDISFNINSWLEREGYLTYNWNYRASKSLSRLGVNRENLRKVSDFLSIRSFLKHIFPKNIRKSIPTEEMKKEAKTERIDWDKSDAIASGQGPIYVLNENKKQELKLKLRGLKDPWGKQILEHVYEKQEIYSGKYLDEAPDLIMDQAPHVHIKGSIGKGSVFVSPDRWKAENKKYGLFIATGPSFSKTERIETLSILDLAPLILTLYGIEKHRTMDGKVQYQILNESL